MFTYVYHCLFLFTYVYNVMLVHVYEHLPIFTRVYMLTFVYLCLPLFSRDYIYILVFSCFLVFNYVYLGLLVFTYVSQCLLFTHAKAKSHVWPLTPAVTLQGHISKLITLQKGWFSNIGSHLLMHLYLC